MDARSVNLSYQVDMDQGNQSRKIIGMANVKWAQRQQILFQNERNTKGTYEPDEKKRVIDEAKADPTGGPKHNNAAMQEITRCLHQSVRCLEHRLLRPNRPVPDPIATRKQIHYVNGRYR